MSNETLTDEARNELTRTAMVLGLERKRENANAETLTEALGKLAEEYAFLLQLIGKIQRVGLYATHRLRKDKLNIDVLRDQMHDTQSVQDDFWRIIAEAGGGK